MKLRHPWVIDTAVLFKHPKGPPFKPGLKYLAKTLLEKDIQQNIGGHDPEEDARTCMELLELKLKLGKSFVLALRFTRGSNVLSFQGPSSVRRRSPSRSSDESGDSRAWLRRWGTSRRRCLIAAFPTSSQAATMSRRQKTARTMTR